MSDALVSNGLDFIEKSAAELQDEPKFSVAHFATGVELLLKARLFYEHWSLVSTTPHATPWTGIKDGTFTTVKAGDLASTLTSLTGTPLASLKTILGGVFSHRNQALHFIPPRKLADIAAEQFRAWYHLHQLIVGPWKDAFCKFSDRITRVDESLRAHRECLDVRFEELSRSSHFVAPERTDRLIDCLVCGHRSGVLDDASPAPNDPDVILTNVECPVCLSALEVVNFGCGEWHSFSDGIYDSVSCICPAGSHSAQELAIAMDRQPLFGKDALIDGPTEAHCGTCLTLKTVVATGAGFRCYACGEDFEEDARGACEWCNEPWVGYRGGDRWKGCEICDGQEGWVRDE